jgi:hypothetical protein
MAALLSVDATLYGSRANSRSMPLFTEAKTLPVVPEGRALGDVSAVALASDDTVWILHRPNTLASDQRSKALPPVSHFDAEGHFLGGFGGPADGYEWPTVEHSIAVTPVGHIWVSGSARTDPAKSDDILLEFTGDGRFVRQIGRRGASKGNADFNNFHAPGDLAVDWPRRELYVADGYGNQRVAVVSLLSGKVVRSWGAFGSALGSSPQSPTSRVGKVRRADRGEGPPYFDTVHGVAISRDGKVYVSDRNNQRIQVFTRLGRYLGQVFIDRDLPSPITASGIAFSCDPKQRHLYVADFGNASLVVVDRNRLTIVGRVGKAAGTQPELTTPHLIQTDDAGQIYVAEVAARRVARFRLTGECR